MDKQWNASKHRLFKAYLMYAKSECVKRPDEQTRRIAHEHIHISENISAR